MIHAASEGLYHALHLQLEEQSRQLSDRDASLHADDVQLQVVGLFQQTHNARLIRREIHKQAPFDTLGFSLLSQHIILPTHRLDKIVSTSNQPRHIVANQMVTSLTIFHVDGTRKGKHGSIVTL